MILLTFLTKVCLINCFWLGDGVYVEYDRVIVTIQNCGASLGVQKLFSTVRFENITTEFMMLIKTREDGKCGEKYLI